MCAQGSSNAAVHPEKMEGLAPENKVPEGKAVGATKH